MVRPADDAVWLRVFSASGLQPFQPLIRLLNRSVRSPQNEAGGGPFTIKGTYIKVDRPALLEFTWLPDWQPDATETTVRVEFTEIGGATHVRLTHSGLTTESSRASHRGWPQILALLKGCVESSA